MNTVIIEVSSTPAGSTQDDLLAVPFFEGPRGPEPGPGAAEAARVIGGDLAGLLDRQGFGGRPGDAARSAATAQRLHRRWGAGGFGDPLAGLGLQGATAPLSHRESEVIALLASGQANAEMATALGVSVHTIERHVANIFLKIGVRNRAEATAWAHRHGRVP